MYKGELLFPVINDYPETKFGGFFAETSYRDPFIADEINANGWMIWPPIRFSYRTVDEALSVPVPSPPSWLQTAEVRRERSARDALRDDDRVQEEVHEGHGLQEPAVLHRELRWQGGPRLRGGLSVVDQRYQRCDSGATPSTSRGAASSV